MNMPDIHPRSLNPCIIAYVGINNLYEPSDIFLDLRRYQAWGLHREQVMNI